MFRVLSGWPERYKMSWLRGKAGDIFDYTAKENWFTNRIVRDALYEIDHIVEVKGLAFLTEDGRVIPTNWLSQGVRQFVSMTVKNDKVCDGYYFGHNVYKYFYRWARETGENVTILANSSETFRYPELEGYDLNEECYFENGGELSELILRNRMFLLGEEENGFISAQPYELRDGKVWTYGETRKMKL